tara:strand:- start:797 stop:913 length:117 start_codon:yes stop_codon:yes gene_type:complete
VNLDCAAAIVADITPAYANSIDRISSMFQYYLSRKTII